MFLLPGSTSPAWPSTVRRKDRDWMVLDPPGQQVCLTVYKRGAVEVVRRLAV